MMLSLRPINRKNVALITTLNHGFEIKGVVRRLGVNYRAFVQLFEKSSGILIEQVKTNEVGEYRFRNLSNTFKFMVIAKDPNNQYNAVIQDNVVPK